MLKDANDSFEGQTVVVYGSGNVSTFVLDEAHDYRAKVLSALTFRLYIGTEVLDLDVGKVFKEVKGDRISTYVNYRPNVTLTERVYHLLRLFHY
ncbi:Glutamate dehydrogenase OS=Lysinibacillus sphaericus OX=1421 GN=LS41612_14620 PE=3 SV=1 [Lysinibacillus sphaericus]